MSHFSVLVIGPDVERQLAPFHEFECTGTDDEFVQDIDRTDEARAEFEAATTTRMRAPDGSLHELYDLKGNYREEFSQPGERGRRELFVPAGWEKVEVPAKEHDTFARWASEYYGWAVLTVGSAPEEAHKFGRVEVDADGQVVRCIDRTNPNKKWDWWAVGGRWQGLLLLKDGRTGTTGEAGLLGARHPNGGVDHALKGDIDFDRMRDLAGERAGAQWDKVRAVTGSLEDFIPWPRMRDEVHAGDINAARDAYHAQRAKKALAEAGKADNDLFWVELDGFIPSREEFVTRARDGAIGTFAVVRDGQWHQRGDMGWFGFVSDEKDTDAWNREFAALLDALPDDTQLTVVDCHI